MRAQFGDLGPEAIALYEAAGEKEPPVDAIYGDLHDRYGSDVSFRIPGIIHGEWHAQAGNRVWQYEFDRATAPRPRVRHSDELPFVFGNFYRDHGAVTGEFDATDRRLSTIVQAYWANFATTGNPNGPGVPEWPEFDQRGRKFMRFSLTGEAAAAADQRGRFVDLFRRSLERDGK